MNSATEAVVFPNHQGMRLFGIAHVPAAGEPAEVGVLLLSPGVKSRVAPHRLYNCLATALAADGFPVLRFDFHGLGDSAGTLGDEFLESVYETIQLGRFVDDSIVAIDWMVERFGCRRVVLAGLCGGAITALLAAHRDPRVTGVLGLGLPVVMRGRDIDYRQYMSTGQLNSLGTRYLQKLLKPSAWLRLLTFRTDYRVMVKALATRLRGALGGDAAQRQPKPSAELESHVNALLHPAMQAVLSRGGRVCLMFGEADRLGWEFDEYYMQVKRAELAAYAALLSVQVLPVANHVLTFSEWQRDMIERSRVWMRGETQADVAAVSLRPIAARSA